MVRVHHGESEQEVGTARFVCISDTHDVTDPAIVPHGDVLLHCGDFTANGRIHEVESFNVFLGQLGH